MEVGLDRPSQHGRQAWSGPIMAAGIRRGGVLGRLTKHGRRRQKNEEEHRQGWRSSADRSSSQPAPGKPSALQSRASRRPFSRHAVFSPPFGKRCHLLGRTNYTPGCNKCATSEVILNRAAPLLVVLLHDDRATICGPAGDQPPVCAGARRLGRRNASAARRWNNRTATSPCNACATHCPPWTKDNGRCRASLSKVPRLPSTHPRRAVGPEIA